jgi:hypothetical protein
MTEKSAIPVWVREFRQAEMYGQLCGDELYEICDTAPEHVIAAALSIAKVPDVKSLKVLGRGGFLGADYIAKLASAVQL